MQAEILLVWEGTSAVTDSGAARHCLGGAWALLRQTLRCGCSKTWEDNRRGEKSGGKGCLYCLYILLHKLIFLTEYYSF